MKTNVVGMFLPMALVLSSCGNPDIRNIERTDSFVQGQFPKHTDMMVVLDVSPSDTGGTYRKNLKTEMEVMVQEMNTKGTSFRLGVTTTGASRDASMVQFVRSAGIPAYGMNGSFSTSADNSSYITEGADSLAQFRDGFDKASILPYILGTQYQNYQYFSPISGFGSYFIQSYGTISFQFPQVSFSSCGGASGCGGLTGLPGLNNENFFTAIEMANEKQSGIFNDKGDLDRNNIPLVILMMTDGTGDSSPGYTLESSKSLLRDLRRHSIEGVEKSNLSVYGIVKTASTSAGVARVKNTIEELVAENDGVKGQVFNITDSFSGIISSIGDQLKQPTGHFCLSNKASSSPTLKVKLNGVQQNVGTDVTYDSINNCIDFTTVPAPGAFIEVSYR